ncbi:hypothetical protein [Bradyrhizobium sp. SBR1B]|uniref:hypothetical protein n=1 Tax=Bradyrhizobium sp. SBR1B TaxID=2663836 RepID=UPI001606DEA2|nr:hypothetical protein [Bradyrhizobium sp. SBR1B]MBB4375614.1 hypothetical protein [Bradyrhizobium sp. SBR1B]
MDTSRGYIAVPRALLSDDRTFANEPYTEREAFLSLVADAAWKPRKLRLRRGVVDLDRGQTLASSRYLAERWQWPEPRVRRFLDRLSGRRANDAQNDAPNDAQSDALIDAHPTPNGTIITIRNYDTFQKEAKPEKPPSDAHSDAQHDALNDAPPDSKSTQREEEINNNTPLKGSERARATALPDDFSLDDQTYNRALEQLGSADAVTRSLSRFRDHHRSKGTFRCDWQAAARLWIDDDMRGGRRAPGPAAKPRKSPDDHAWDQVLTSFKSTGNWTKYVDEFGPDPSSPACRVPEHMLLKYGLAKAAA